MTTRRLAAICSFVALLSVAMAGQGQQSRTSVVGYLWTTTDSPIAGAQVHLRDVRSGIVEAVTRTTEKGEFAFSNVPPGQYVVEYLTEGGSVMAVGKPFTLTAGETVATFVRLASASRVIMPDKGRISVSGGMAWTRDLTNDNKFMPGLFASVDLPIGRGQWVAIEGSYHWQEYPPVSGSIPEIRRWGGSVAGRVGRASGNGVFFQVAGGLSVQTLDGIGGSRDTAPFSFGGGSTPYEMWWLGPGLGVDIRVSDRFAVRGLAEAMILPQTPRDHLVASRFKVGLVYRLSPR